MKIYLIYHSARVGTKSIGRLIKMTLEIPLSQKAYSVVGDHSEINAV